MNGFWTHLPIFWRFQLIGWSIFATATFPTKVLVCGDVSDAAISFLLRDGISFLLTLGMRVIYQGIYRHHKNPVWIITSILGVSSVATLLQLPPFYWLGEIYPYEERTIFGPYAAEGILLFRGGQFVGWSILYFGIKTWQEKETKEAKLKEERSMREQVELQMLRSLTNSHFLCNALSTIKETLDKGKQGASEMVQSMSDYLHYSLKHRSDNVVALGEEVEALEDYLTLQHASLGTTLDFGLQVKEELCAAMVPGFVLQPLVENAIKYGREEHHPRVTIRVLIQQQGDDLVFEVYDTGHWIVPDPHRQSGGVGLETIKRKLQWLYPDQHSITTLEEEGWVSVRIQFPLRL